MPCWPRSRAVSYSWRWQSSRALIGAALGFPGGYQALVAGVMAGGIVILLLFVTGVVSRRQAVPYAPFLALSAVAVVLTHGANFAPL
jgi:prepilin signal peptidase PulO-like enzyme (type II secretory pathway)